MLEEIALWLTRLPPDILRTLLELVKTLVLAKSEEDQRRAMDAALAATEAEIVRQEFPR